METSGLTVSDNGGIGLTTAEMMDPYRLGLNGFANDSNWILDAGRDYPRLAWEGTAGQIIPEPVIDWLDGQGTEEEPYRIDTADQLILLGRASVLWYKHFILGADIDLDPNLQGRRVFSQAVIQSFDGVFDGNGHTISHLTISGGSGLGQFEGFEGRVGLFGDLGRGATISNLGLEVVHINGDGYAGGLVGTNWGNITNCYSTGSVSGTSYVGGLVGINLGSITNCYSTGSVSGDRLVGGLVGVNVVSQNYRANISTSYSTGSVNGDSSVGGLVGSNDASITSSYSTGMVIGNENVGGLVGSNSSNRYWGNGNGSITSSFWDIETSNRTNMCGIQEEGATGCDDSCGKTTAEMQTESTFTDAGWDFVDEIENGIDNIWWIDEGHDYPRLWWELSISADHPDYDEWLEQATILGIH
jgi:hypothetical protein